VVLSSTSFNFPPARSCAGGLRSWSLLVMSARHYSISRPTVPHRLQRAGGEWPSQSRFLFFYQRDGPVVQPHSALHHAHLLAQRQLQVREYAGHPAGGPVVAWKVVQPTRWSYYGRFAISQRWPPSAAYKSPPVLVNVVEHLQVW
jgi:hypothetical protein